MAATEARRRDLDNDGPRDATRLLGGRMGFFKKSKADAPAAVSVGSPFIALDFETANEQPGSPCSAGWAIVEDGRIVDVGAMKIRPPAFRFCEANIAIHGIRPEDVADAPQWPDALALLVGRVGGRPVVAHNASFDAGVMHQACDLAGVRVPEIRFACSMDISRSIWPELHSHRLGDVADSLGFPPFVHHEAGADAKVAAGIVLAAGAELGTPPLLELLTALDLGLSLVSESSYHAFGYHDGNHRIPRTPTPGSAFDASHPLFGKKVTFTGDFASMERLEAQQAVLDAGGRPMTNISRLTNIVVAGSVFTGLVPGHESSKLEKARALNAEGAHIEFITELEFLNMIHRGESS